MHQDTKNQPNLKAIEEFLFHELQRHFQTVLTKLLEEVDVWLMENRDGNVFQYKEKQGTTLETLFGPVRIRRRKYKDRERNERISLLDQYLQFDGGQSLSPLVAKTAIEWAVRGPSYRDARDRLHQLLGYQGISHEQIRQKVLGIEEPRREVGERKNVDTLFLEVDGLNASLQKSETRSREIKTAIIHEGWERRGPQSKDFQLKNKSFVHSEGTGKTFWETVSDGIDDHYNLTSDTFVIINGDGASWIREGATYFRNGIYIYDRFHLKKWIKQALGNRTKEQRKKVYKAAEGNDPTALLAAVAEAEKAEDNEEKKQEITALRVFILNHQKAFQDYRFQLKENGIDTSRMRGMGSAESNMNLLSRRLTKMGYSWSVKGLEAMINAMICLFEGTLTDAVEMSFSEDGETGEEPEKERVSISKLLKQKVQTSVGAVFGRMPALTARNQNQPFVEALKNLSGLT